MAKIATYDPSREVKVTIPVKEKMSEDEALPQFSTETVQYTKIRFPDGKPSAGVRSLLKSRNFVFNRGDDVGPYWFGETEKLEGTGFDAK